MVRPPPFTLVMHTWREHGKPRPWDKDNKRDDVNSSLGAGASEFSSSPRSLNQSPRDGNNRISLGNGSSAEVGSDTDLAKVSVGDRNRHLPHHHSHHHFHHGRPPYLPPQVQSGAVKRSASQPSDLVFMNTVPRSSSSEIQRLRRLSPPNGISDDSSAHSAVTAAAAAAAVPVTVVTTRRVVNSSKIALPVRKVESSGNLISMGVGVATLPPSFSSDNLSLHAGMHRRSLLSFDSDLALSSLRQHDLAAAGMGAVLMDTSPGTGVVICSSHLVKCTTVSTSSQEGNNANDRADMFGDDNDEDFGVETDVQAQATSRATSQAVELSG
mmetsp:Transcript_5999/g.10798  ORF Transcript_5999/g.10798 Transcript_5999/m.10798 type:complete len:326 (-) Transcript_5999:383-1360(-)